MQRVRGSMPKRAAGDPEVSLNVITEPEIKLRHLCSIMIN